MKYRILIYGTSRATGLLAKYTGWSRDDTPQRRNYHLTRAGDTLIAPQIVSVELVRVRTFAIS